VAEGNGAKSAGRRRSELVRAAGLEPAQASRPYGFSYPLRLSPPDPARLGAGWVWGLDYPFTLAVRR